MVIKINTGKYERVISKVLVDNREKGRIKYAMEQYAPFNPSVIQLDVGDYVFIGDNGVKVCIEYKTGSDFLNSITQDNHLHNQVYFMNKEYDYTFIMIESEDLMHETEQLYYSSGVSVNMQQINGAISTFNTESTVLMAQTTYQAFDLMMRTAGKIILQEPIRYKYGRKTTNSALNYLSSIKGLDSKAGIICRQLDLRTLNDLLNLTANDLITVNGVGKKLAEKILSELGVAHNGLQEKD